jgi:hypothetical protein
MTSRKVALSAPRKMFYAPARHLPMGTFTVNSTTAYHSASAVISCSLNSGKPAHGFYVREAKPPADPHSQALSGINPNTGNLSSRTMGSGATMKCKCSSHIRQGATPYQCC